MWGINDRFIIILTSRTNEQYGARYCSFEASSALRDWIFKKKKKMKKKLFICAIRYTSASN